jgi:TonB-linked SusC/RagA family outer membrane protein
MHPLADDLFYIKQMHLITTFNRSNPLFALIFCFWLLTPLSIFAQKNKTVTGTVYDAKTRQGVAGASLKAQSGDKTYGTFTDKNGLFSLEMAENITKISVTLIGYTTQDVKISDNQPIVVYLEEGVELLEAVVTALGLERQSKSLGYAVQQLDGAELSKVKSANFLDNLAGRVAGVTVTGGSSGVGSSTKINIRGESSFTNTNPLFVVDGIPINNNTVVNTSNDDANGFMEVDFGNGAMEVNQDDIASVTVLKGASAAALYGTRASNGVIIIKTKNGATSKGTGISFNTSVFMETPFRLPQFQNTYGLGNSGKYAYKDGLGGGINDNITYSYGPRLDAGLQIAQFDSPVSLPDGSVVRAADNALYKNLPITPTPFVAHPNNLKDFYETGHTFINNLSFTTGNAKSNMRLSMTDLNSQSYIPGVDLKRRTIAAALNFNPVEQLTISSNINYIHASSKNRPATKYGSENINYAMVAWFGRSNSIESLKNYWQPGLENVQQFSYNYTFFDNPYFTLYENRNGFGRDRMLGNISARYAFTPALSIALRSGMDYSDEDRTFRRSFSTNRFKTGAYAEQNVFFREINTDVLLNYSKTMRDFSFDISAGANRMDQQNAFEQIQTTSLAQAGVYALTNAAAPLEYFTNVGRKRINSVYGIAKLGFRDLLYVDITGRNDWSSALATTYSAANTSFFYPSVSAGLVLSNWMTLPEQISFFKVRGSFARVGNDTNPFQTNGAYVARTNVNGQPTFSEQNLIPNAGLKPESITSVELGTDIRFFDDRLKLDVTYFDALNKNQIISLPISITSGYTQQNINGGSVRTKGWEAVIEWMPVRTKHFTWHSALNFTTYRNTVESLPQSAKTITLAYNSIYDNVNQTVWYQVQEGGRLGDMWGTGYLRNTEGDLIVGADGRYIVNNNLIKLGNYNPDFMVGLNNNISFKNFHLSFLIDWRQGGAVVSRSLALAGVAGQLIETENRPTEGIVAEGVVNIGSPEAPVYQANTKAIPAESYYRMYYDRNHEEHNTYDASYVKIREIQFGYQLPQTFFKGFFEDVNLSLVARNVFAFSKIPHFDPEQFGFQQQKLVSGVEDMSYPTTRSIGVKLNVNF